MVKGFIWNFSALRANDPTNWPKPILILCASGVS
jgi:hypothetical protein